MATEAICNIEVCDKPILARGLCRKHYQQWRKSAADGDVRVHARAGEPLAWIEARASYAGNDCLIWPFAKYPSGYGMLNLSTGATMASRVMCRLAHGDPADETEQAAHRCGRGADGCMTPRHLYWATRPENEADKIGHGTTNRGSRNGQARLSEEEVRAIRRSSERTGVLAARYEISAPTICDIRSRRSWAWLPD